MHGSFFSHRSHRFNRTSLRTISSSQKAFGIQISQSVTANEDTNKKAKSSFSLMHGSFFSHRSHRFNRTSLRTVSNPQNASGIQISQNVTAKGGCKVL